MIFGRSVAAPREVEVPPAWVVPFYVHGVGVERGGEGFGDYVREYFLEYADPPTWRRWRDVILEAWARTHPGTRPGVWWRTVAAEGRRVTRGAAGVDLTGTWDGQGLPHYRRLPGDVDPEFEAELAYLRRLNLLLPGEARRLGA